MHGCTNVIIGNVKLRLTEKQTKTIKHYGASLVWERDKLWNTQKADSRNIARWHWPNHNLAFQILHF